MRRTLLLLAMAAMALMVAMPMALAAVRTGTDGPETLTGTNDNDRITGKGGDDITNGKKGNDAYNYADGWGIDGIKDSGGRDTLNFSAVSAGMPISYLCTDYTDGTTSLGYAQDSAGNAVVFGKGIVPEITENAPMENIRLGSGSGTVLGCGQDNGYSAGGGQDQLFDYGGIVLPSQGLDFPKSDEVYSGLGTLGQVAVILDGGGQDMVNLKPYTTGAVDLVKQDVDGNGTAESLIILTSPNTGFVIYDANNTLVQSGLTLDGRIEKVIFKNKTVSSTTLMNQATAASASAQAMAEEGSEALDPASMLEDVQLP